MISRKYHLLVSLAGALVSIDQLTKFSISYKLSEGQSLDIGIPFFQFTLIKNRGAIFGLFGDLDPALREPLFILLPLFTLALFIALFFKLSEKFPFTIFSFCFIVGGALGNLLDRIRLGYVVDFLDLHWRNALHFPAFNVADMSISAGVVLLAWAIFFERENFTNDDLVDE